MKKLYILCILLVVVTFTVSAEKMELDLTSCIELAIENNPDFRISGISLETAERNNSRTWNNFLPQISAGVGLSGNAQFFTPPPSISLGTSGSVSMSLSLSPSIISEIKALRLAYESEQISYDTALQGLQSSVEQEFYYLLTSESNIEIAESNLELARKNYQQTLSNYNYGMTSELSVLQAQVAAANLEPAYKETVATYESAVQEFLLILGLNPDTELKLIGNLETQSVTFSPDRMIATYVSNRSDILAQKKQIEILQNNRKRSALASMAPSLRLSSGYSISGWQEWRDSLSLGLNLSIPIDGLIPGSSTSTSLAAMDDQIKAAEIRLEKTISRARTEITNLVATIDTSLSNMELSEMNITLAEKTYEMTEQSYARGSVDRLEVEDAQQAYLSAKQQYLSSQYRYLSSLINLRDALALESLDELYAIGEINE